MSICNGNISLMGCIDWIGGMSIWGQVAVAFCILLTLIIFLRILYYIYLIFE